MVAKVKFPIRWIKWLFKRGFIMIAPLTVEQLSIGRFCCVKLAKTAPPIFAKCRQCAIVTIMVAKVRSPLRWIKWLLKCVFLWMHLALWVEHLNHHFLVGFLSCNSLKYIHNKWLRKKSTLYPTSLFSFSCQQEVVNL